MGSTTRESLVYRIGFEQGRLAGGQRLMLAQRTANFGPSDLATTTRVSALDEWNELVRVGVRLLSVRTWDELFAGGEGRPELGRTTGR